MERIEIFTEQQHFRQIWIWIQLLTINGFFIFGVMKQVIGGETFGDKPASDAALLMLLVFTILLSVFVFMIKLETSVTKEGIYVRFFPFLIKEKFFAWDNLVECYIRKYAPIREYGGWGIRYSLFGKGKAYNISGNYGLQLKFKDGKALLIGTNKPEELENALLMSHHIKKGGI